MDISAILLQRIFAAQGTSRLAKLLRSAKGEDVPRGAFRTTGTREQLEEAANSALLSGYISTDDLAQIVDEVEENGAQHVFLFNLTDAGKKALTRAAIEKSVPVVPPSAALYGEAPQRRSLFIDRGGEGFGVKQVFTSDYWELDRARSKDTDEERVSWYVKKHRRAVNVMLVRPDENELEVRIDRVRSSQDDRLATRNYQLFEASLVGLFDRVKHAEPLRFTPSQLAKIASAKKETYMTVDEAEDGDFSQRISNTRERAKGLDVREYEHYALDGKGLKRTSLNIYWRVNDEKIHSILSNVPLLMTDDPTADELGAKVYLPATLQPQDMRHVIDRIRHFAS